MGSKSGLVKQKNPACAGFLGECGVGRVLFPATAQCKTNQAQAK
jgi:hypothetical protein